jgi:ABC-2 type transport system permease protein
MIADVRTIMWKEWRELMRQRGSVRTTVLTGVIPMVLVGIVIPWQMASLWVKMPIFPLVMWAWLPLIFVTIVIADAFAGERERHTLETLLASRMPDQAILFGKIATAVVYAWMMTMLLVLMGTATLKIKLGGGGFLPLPVMIYVAGMTLIFLAATMAASAGVLISLRCATVRQAQQVLSFTVMVPILPLWFVPLLPARWSGAIGAVLESGNVMYPVLAAVAGLITASIALVGAAMLRFQRARLIHQ